MKQAPFLFGEILSSTKKVKQALLLYIMLCFCLRQRFSEMKNERIKAKLALL